MKACAWYLPVALTRLPFSEALRSRIYIDHHLTSTSAPSAHAEAHVLCSSHLPISLEGDYLHRLIGSSAGARFYLAQLSHHHCPGTRVRQPPAQRGLSRAGHYILPRKGNESPHHVMQILLVIPRAEEAAHHIAWRLLEPSSLQLLVILHQSEHAGRKAPSQGRASDEQDINFSKEREEIFLVLTAEGVAMV